MKQIGIITGDLVDSRHLPGKSREKLYADFKQFLAELKQLKWISGYEVFRGDSFQCIIEKKEQALRVALLIRTFIKSYISLEQASIQSRKTRPAASKGYFPARQDIRLGIGIGGIDFIKKDTLAHSDGEAFRLSGETLDGLKGVPYRMMIKTNDQAFNNSIEPSILLLDAVMQKWTNNQAETVLLKLKDLTEEEIAKKLKITQSAVNQRSKTAQWFAIEKLLAYFENALKP